MKKTDDAKRLICLSKLCATKNNVINSIVLGSAAILFALPLFYYTVR